jgi:hypothetical protein
MNEIVKYTASDNKIVIDVEVEKDTVWLTQQQMALLFNQTKQNISLHINNIFREKELWQNAVVKDSLTTASDGKNQIALMCGELIRDSVVAFFATTWADGKTYHF